MEILNESDLRELMNGGEGFCVSLYLPTGRNGVLDAGEDVLRLKNLLHEAKSRLLELGCESDQADKLLAAAYKLQSDEDFWKRRGNGLALFISPVGLRTYRLPMSLVADMYVGRSFYITPLIELLTGNQKFYILGISRGSARLLEGDRFTAREVEVPGMPENLDEAQWFKETDKLQQIRSGGGEAGSYHGEGDDTRQPNSDEREYLLKVDAAVKQFLINKHDPLIVIGLSPLPGLYAGLSKYQNIIGEVEHNAEVSSQELHRLAWPLVEPLTLEPVRAASSAYAGLAAKEPARAMDDPELICVAAEEGRVDTLLVAGPVPHREVVAFGERIESAHVDSASPSTPQLERASRATLANSGRVLVVPATEMPGTAAMAAILRY